jgi:hypothetical protein
VHRSRISALDRELELSERADLREERDALAEQLAQATGLLGDCGEPVAAPSEPA